MKEQIKAYIRKIIYQKPKRLWGIEQANIAFFVAKYPQITYFLREETHDWRNYPSPIHFPEDTFEALKPFVSKVQWVGMEIQDKGFYFANNHLISPQKELIYEADLPSVPAMNSYLPPFFKIKKVKGTIAYLSNTMPQNYSHFVRYMFAMLSLYDTIWGLEQIDYYYLGDYPPAPFMLEMLAKVPIKPAQLLYTPCQADKILNLVPKRLFQKRKYWDYGSYNFVKQTMYALAQDMMPNPNYKKVYILRGNVEYRKVLNEEALKTYLQAKGFVFLVMDILSIKEQISIFRYADYIIAPHGSALTNLIYCQEGTKVIEILPHNHEDMSIYTHSLYGKLHYAYMRGKPINTQVAPCYEDIEVDLDKLARLMSLVET